MTKVEILTIDNFDKEFKKLSKKYRSLRSDLSSLIAKITENPTIGQPLGKNVFKVRMAISSKNKGKSGGARIITYFLNDKNEVHLLSIYDKSEQVTVSDTRITDLVGKVLQ